MMYFKRVIILLLAVSMLMLAACGGNGENANGGAASAQPGNAGTGRYVETDITPPVQGRFTSYLADDGAIVCYDTGLKTRYESADGGESWTNSPGPGSNTERYVNARAGTLLPDGRLLAYIEGEGLVVIAPDGSGVPYTLAEIDEAVAKGENVSISILQALSNDRFALGYLAGGMVMQTRRSGPEGGDSNAPASTPGGQNGNVQRGPGSSPMINKTLLLDIGSGEIIAELPVENASSAASDGDSLYLMDSAGKVSVFNLTDGTASGKPGISFGGSQNTGGQNNMSMMLSATGGGMLTIGSDGSLYAAHDKNVLRTDSTGGVSTVLESTSYSIGAPRSQLGSVFMLEGGEIVVSLTNNGQENRLYKYVWDDNASIDPGKTLTVWSLTDNNFVRAAIAELRKKHPDASITYEVALEGDNAVSTSDAIKTLNTRLLSDSGPDVIILDGCPVESYADKGMLLELGGLLDTGDVYENLLDPYAKDGKIYCLPAQFLMPALMGSAAALAKAGTLDELVALVVSGNDAPASVGTPGGNYGIPEAERPELYFENLKELCDVLWLSSAPSIVSDNQLNTEALREYLEAAKAVSDKYNLTEAAQGGRGGLRVGFSDGGMAAELPGSLVRYTTQMANYGAFSAGNLQLLQMMMERAGSELMLFPGLTSGAWEPSTVAGISADTKVKDFATEFLQAMLSEEVQQLNYGTGMPVTRSGIAEQVDAINERLAENGEGSFELNVDALIGQLKIPSMGDTALTDMMWSTVEKCCKGEIDVEGAVREIEQNVKNYLAERS